MRSLKDLVDTAALKWIRKKENIYIDLPDWQITVDNQSNVVVVVKKQKILIVIDVMIPMMMIPIEHQNFKIFTKRSC